LAPYTLTLAGCQNKVTKIKPLPGPYNDKYRPYAEECIDRSGSVSVLTGGKLATEQVATLDAKKKEREVRGEPEADRAARMQREILAAQQ
jgi:hypothetical protein